MAPPSVSVALLSASPGLSPSFSWPWVEVSLRILSPPLFPRLLPWQCVPLYLIPRNLHLRPSPWPLPHFHPAGCTTRLNSVFPRRGSFFFLRWIRFFQLPPSSHRPAVFSGFLPVNLALSPSSHRCDLPTLTPKTSPGGDASVPFLLPLLFMSPPQFLN